MERFAIVHTLVLFNLIKKEMIKLNADTGYSQPYCKILYLIQLLEDKKKVVYQKDLEAYFFSKANLSEMLLKVEQDGLIERLPDENDSRTKKITFTELGKKVIYKVCENEAIIQEKLLKNISPDEYEIYKKIVLQFEENLKGEEHEKR